jgi:hypothetical protein
MFSMEGRAGEGEPEVAGNGRSDADSDKACRKTLAGAGPRSNLRQLGCPLPFPLRPVGQRTRWLCVTSSRWVCPYRGRTVTCFISLFRKLFKPIADRLCSPPYTGSLHPGRLAAHRSCGGVAEWLQAPVSNRPAIAHLAQLGFLSMLVAWGRSLRLRRPTDAT